MIYFNKKFLILFLMLFVFFNNNAKAEENINNHECNYNLKASVDLDERFFTLFSWLNFILNTDETRMGQVTYPEQINIRKYLDTLPKDLLKKNREEYNNFMPTLSMFTKNGIFISLMTYYGSPPEFIITKPKNTEISDIFEELEMPSSRLIKEFYEKADIHKLWETKYKDLYKNTQSMYSKGINNILKKTLCDFKTEQIHPVSISFNLLGIFAQTGQSVFSDENNKFIIMFNPSLNTLLSEDKMTLKYYIHEDLKIIRHEFSHSLFNDEVGKQKYLISEKLEKMQKELNMKILAPEELVARCIHHYDNIEALISNKKLAYNYENVLFLHFMEKLPDFKKSNKSFKEFIPELFNTFDADKEIKRWKDLSKKYKKKEKIEI